MNRVFPVVVLLIVTLTAVHGSLAVKPVMDLISRRVPDLYPYVHLMLRPSPGALDSFQYYAQNGTLYIEGTSVTALTGGLYQYLKTEQGCIFTWGENNTGSQMHVTVPPPTVAPYRGTSPYNWRYSWNVCTYGYTATWWDADRWAWEVDWLALHGINMPLAFLGQEYVWAQVWTEFGITEDELQQWFSGPAFLPWQRMGNMAVWLGPLSPTYRYSQRALQEFVLGRMKGLGMTPVLPCFGGHVPPAISRVFPTANVTKSTAWVGFPATYLLEATDPLYQTLGKKFVETQNKIFGDVTDYYNCDTYNEMDPRSADPAYLKAAGAAVISSLRAADTNAKWVMQGWLFHSGFWSDPSRVQSYLSGIPNDQMIILDLNSEEGALAPKYQQYFGKAWIWNLLHNYGGQRGVYGNLTRVATGPVEDFTASGSTMNGIGFTPEAIEQNPVMYELLTDMAWTRDPIDVKAWIVQYVRGRYGYKGVPGDENMNAVTAWGLLRESVYSNPNFPSSEMHLMPSFCNFGGSSADPATLTTAWSFLLNASNVANPPMSSVNPYLYDLVDVGRQVLSDQFLNAHRFLCAAYDSWDGTSPNGNAAGRTGNIGGYMGGILNDADTLVGTNPNFLLGKWIARSIAASTSKNETDQFVLNAANQVTLWGPNGEINDYAAKGWQGLYGQYYAQRWNLLISESSFDMSNGIAFDSNLFYRMAIGIGKDFYSNPEPLKRFPSTPVNPDGDYVISLSRSLFQKYTVYSGPSSYQAIEGKDIPGNDLISQPLRGSVGQMLNICDLDSTCKCVNSNGWVKTTSGGQVPSTGTTLYCKP